MSAISDFIEKLKNVERRSKELNGTTVRLGWVGKAKEQKRSMSKGKALAINAGRKKAKKKGKGEIVSNFDADFTGPGIAAASLAQIAKTLNYGREGGISKKDGHKYGRIPA